MESRQDFLDILAYIVSKCNELCSGQISKINIQDLEDMLSKLEEYFEKIKEEFTEDERNIIYLVFNCPRIIIKEYKINQDQKKTKTPKKEIGMTSLVKECKKLNDLIEELKKIKDFRFSIVTIKERDE